MNLAKLYVFHLDRNPTQLFFAYRDPRGGFNSWCKRCMGSGLVGTSHTNGLGMIFVLHCKKCEITKKIQVVPEELDQNYKIGRLYQNLVDKNMFSGYR